MTAFFQFLSTFLWCSTIFAIASIVALSLPKSKFREVMRAVVGAAGVVLCGLYVVSPVDLFPEAVLGPVGYIDDIGAVIAGYMSLKSAIKAHKALQVEYVDE